MLSDLILVLKQIKRILDEYNLPGLYNNYADTLQSISQSSTEELQNALKDDKKRIKEAHNDFDGISWSFSQLEITKNFGATVLLGKTGLQVFLDSLSENSANTPGAIEEIRKLGEELSKLSANVTTVLSGLGGLAEIQNEEIQKGDLKLELVFGNEVSVNNLTDLKNRSDDWYLIVHATKLLDPKTITEIQINRMSKNSPFLVELCGPYAQIAAVGGVFFLCLQLYERVLKIAKLHLEIAKLEKEDEQERIELEEMLKKKEESLKEKEIENIVRDVIKKYGQSLSGSSSKDAETAWRKASERMYNFVKGGGEARYREGNTGGDPILEKIVLPDIAKLSNDIKEIKNYIDTQRQIEASNKDDQIKKDKSQSKDSIEEKNDA